jgi:hypothetical protein
MILGNLIHYEQNILLPPQFIELSKIVMLPGEIGIIARVDLQ